MTARIIQHWQQGSLVVESEHARVVASRRADQDCRVIGERQAAEHFSQSRLVDLGSAAGILDALRKPHRRRRFLGPLAGARTNVFFPKRVARARLLWIADAVFQLHRPPHHLGSFF
jgi:hypothetical protein